MKRVLSGFIGAAVLVSLPAVAQTVVITPEQSTLVERYVVQEPLPAPVTIEEHQTLRPGSVVPPGVPLQPFRGVSELGKLAYFVSVDNKVVVVDPATRVVVRIFNARS